MLVPWNNHLLAETPINILPEELSTVDSLQCMGHVGPLDVFFLPFGQLFHVLITHFYGSVYVSLHVFLIFYLSTLILEKSTLILNKSTLILEKSSLISEKSILDLEKVDFKESVFQKRQYHATRRNLFLLINILPEMKLRGVYELCSVHIHIEYI